MQIVCLRRRSRESASREDHEYTEGLPTLNLDLEDLDFGGEKIASLLFTRTVGKQNWLDSVPWSRRLHDRGSGRIRTKSVAGSRKGETSGRPLPERLRNRKQLRLVSSSS